MGLIRLSYLIINFYFNVKIRLSCKLVLGFSCTFRPIFSLVPAPYFPGDRHLGCARNGEVRGTKLKSFSYSFGRNVQLNKSQH